MNNIKIKKIVGFILVGIPILITIGLIVIESIENQAIRELSFFFIGMALFCSIFGLGAKLLIESYYPKDKE